jgi:hypothetical protein
MNTKISNIVNKTSLVESNFSHLKELINDKLDANDAFVIEPITPFVVKTYINKLDVNKSTGLDGIGPNILRYCGDHMTTSFAFMINSSIDTCLFPDSLKEACTFYRYSKVTIKKIQATGLYLFCLQFPNHLKDT